MIEREYTSEEAENVKLRARAKELEKERDELWRWAAHAEDCREHEDGPDTCDCGLSALKSGRRAGC